MLCAKVGKIELLVQVSHSQMVIGILDKMTFTELLRHLSGKQKSTSNRTAEAKFLVGTW